MYLEEGVVDSKGYQVRMPERVADTEAHRSRDRSALRGLSVASVQARTEWTLVSWPAFSSELSQAVLLSVKPWFLTGIEKSTSGLACVNKTWETDDLSSPLLIAGPLLVPIVSHW